MRIRKQRKVVRVLTLSAYDGGRHYTSGQLDSSRASLASFNESMSPIFEMVRRLAGYPLGTKIKVTMEVAK